MNDRDRLTADLHDAIWQIEHEGHVATVPTIADRLIAAGWRNVNSPEFVDGLARALAAVPPAEATLYGGDVLLDARADAAAIAKAYREDTDGPE